MASLYRRPDAPGGMYYSNYRDNGERVRTPLSTDRDEAERMLAERILMVKSRKTGAVPRNLSWEAITGRDSKDGGRDGGEYIDYSKLKADNTHDIDVWAIRSFEKRIPITKIAQLTPKALQSYRLAMENEGKKAWTIIRAFRALKALARWCEESGYTTKQNWKLAKCPDIPEEERKAYSIEQVNKLLDAATTEGPMWRLVVLLGTRAGLCRSEMWGLRVVDVNWEEGTLTVTPHSKRRLKNHTRKRILPIDRSFSLELRLAWEKGREYILELDNGSHPSMSWLGHKISKISRAHGLPGELHTLRHTYASDLMNNGVPAGIVMACLGQNNLRTTQIYAKASDARVQASSASLTPLSAT